MWSISVKSTKSNQNYCQSITSTNVSQKPKHEDVKYRYVQQTVQEKTAVCSSHCSVQFLGSLVS